jgi:hypothetical protein
MKAPIVRIWKKGQNNQKQKRPRRRFNLQRQPGTFGGVSKHKKGGD